MHNKNFFLFSYNCLHFALHQSSWTNKKNTHTTWKLKNNKNTSQDDRLYWWKCVYKICMNFQFPMSVVIYVSICLDFDIRKQEHESKSKEKEEKKDSNLVKFQCALFAGHMQFWVPTLFVKHKNDIEPLWVQMYIDFIHKVNRKSLPALQLTIKSNWK